MRNSLCRFRSGLIVILFQQDANFKPPHFDIAVRVILGSEASTEVNWPFRSRGLTALDFFFWWNLEDTVCVPLLPTTLPELPVRIEAAAATFTPSLLADVWPELEYR